MGKDINYWSANLYPPRFSIIIGKILNKVYGRGYRFDHFLLPRRVTASISYRGDVIEQPLPARIGLDAR